MMENPFRKHSAAEQKRLDRGRKMIRSGSKAIDDPLSRFFPSSRYQGRNEMKLGQEELDMVPDRSRNYEAYQDMTYMKKGGSVSSASKRADGCAQRGKTKGKMV
jgi:hypothetical protein